MNAFVSHSYFTDEALSHCLYAAFKAKGINVYDHDALSARLKPIYTGGSDLDDLILAYRRAGRPAPTQERSDPHLHALLVEDIGKQDVVVVLWSEQYRDKFWTRRELTAALSRGVRVVILMLENCTLDDELQRGVNSGYIPLFWFGEGFAPGAVCAAICKFDRSPAIQQPQRILDDGLKRCFLQINHPSLGPYEIAESYFAWSDMKRLGVKEPPSGSKRMDLGGDITNDHIVAFCNFINLQSPYYRYRLPTEVEWEYAARAGNTSSTEWAPQIAESREGVPTIRNTWGMRFAESATEWTSTSTEWQEYNGWVQPLDVKGTRVGPGRCYVVKRVNDGPGRGGFHPRIVHSDETDPRLGFRLVRERRNDISIDQVLPTRHRAVARELLLTTNPEEFRASVHRGIQHGMISRYFRGYLEMCALQGSWEMAEPLLVSILRVAYVPPLTLPPYLQVLYREALRSVFGGQDLDACLSHLLDRLEELNLLRREFAEVLLYEFRQDFGFESVWQACVDRLPDEEKDLLSRFCY